jgi:LysM repeat protein
LQTTHYETQPGDTVASLADKFDISENTIIWTNNLPVSGQLDPGRELLILPISGVLYTTKGGESLDDIAQRFQSDSGAIAQVNDLTGQSTTAAGVQLIIPGGRLDENPRPELSGRSTARPNADRVDDTAQASSPPLLSPQLTTDDNPKSAIGIDSAVELVRSLPFVKAADRVKATPTPEPTPLAPIVYHVVDGDTLLAIAEKYGVSADAIAAASGLQGSGDSLAIDQKLMIPPVPGVIHTVQDGDTLGAIADRYGASEADIVHANGLVSPYVLQIGQVLVVPGGSMNPSPAPATDASATSYEVQDGDSRRARRRRRGTKANRRSRAFSTIVRVGLDARRRRIALSRDAVRLGWDVSVRIRLLGLRLVRLSQVWTSDPARHVGAAAKRYTCDAVHPPAGRHRLLRRNLRSWVVP